MPPPSLSVRAIQIRFHWSDRAEGVLSVDLHPSLPKLLTAGYDGTVKIWSFNREEASSSMQDHSNALDKVMEFASVLTTDEHPTPNVARWSPCGRLILAAYVTGDVVVWKPADFTSGYFDAKDERSLNTEHWQIHRSLKLPNEATDTAFSPCCRFIISSCVSGSVFVHSTDTGAVMQQLTPDDAHEHDCQSVTIDPLGHYAASYGRDRVLKFYQLAPRKHGHGIRLAPTNTIQKRQGTYPLFKDGNSMSRRSSWSPDGAVYACPFGWARDEDEGFRDCVYLFARSNLSKYAAYLATNERHPVIGCRFAPFVLDDYLSEEAEDVHREEEDDEDDEAPRSVLLPATEDSIDGDGVLNGTGPRQLRRRATGAWGPQTYRYLLATWTRDAVSVYTSGSSARVCRLFDLHYDIINDVSFTPDGRFLAVCANDGYVTLARFEKSLGAVVEFKTRPEPLARVVATVTTALREKAMALEASVCDPPPPSAAAGGAVASAKPVVVRKKVKNKPNPPAVPEPTTTEAPPDSLPEQPQRLQPPAESPSAVMDADALAAAMDS